MTRPGAALAWGVLGLWACGADTLGPTSGTLQVTADVGGTGTDPDGFLVVLDRSIRRPIAAGETIAISSVPAGTHEVSLEGVSSDCVVSDASSRAVTTTAGDTARTKFTLSCEAGGAMLQVAVATTGSDIDPNGYQVTIDGQPRVAIPSTGLSILTAPAGEHAITLGGMNPNCAVAGPAAPRVTPVTGQTTTVRFDVQCAPASRAGPGAEIAYDGYDPTNGEPVILVVNADGTHSERMFPQIPYQHDTPSWSPDGGRIAYYTHPDNSTFVLTVADADGQILAEFPERQPFHSPFVAWTADGTGLLEYDGEFTCGVRIRRLDGGPDQALDLDCAGDLMSFSFAPDRQRFAYVARVGEDEEQMAFVAIADLTQPGTKTIPGGCDLVDALSVSWSPDGSKLAVEHGGIVIVDLQQSTCIQVTSESDDRNPVWSPDGTKIAFSARRDGSDEIYTMRPDGSELARITVGDLEAFEPSWRPGP